MRRGRKQRQQATRRHRRAFLVVRTKYHVDAEWCGRRGRGRGGLQLEIHKGCRCALVKRTESGRLPQFSGFFLGGAATLAFQGPLVGSHKGWILLAPGETTAQELRADSRSAFGDAFLSISSVKAFLGLDAALLPRNGLLVVG